MAVLKLRAIALWFHVAHYKTSCFLRNWDHWLEFPNRMSIFEEYPRSTACNWPCVSSSTCYRSLLSESLSLHHVLGRHVLLPLFWTMCHGFSKYTSSQRVPVSFLCGVHFNSFIFAESSSVLGLDLAEHLSVPFLRCVAPALYKRFLLPTYFPVSNKRGNSPCDLLDLNFKKIPPKFEISENHRKIEKGKSS